jgi:hypothetical protein
MNSNVKTLDEIRSYLISVSNVLEKVRTDLGRKSPKSLETVQYDLVHAIDSIKAGHTQLINEERIKHQRDEEEGE